MSNNDVQDQFQDLLHWTKDQGLTPQSYGEEDRFLNPFTRKIRRKKDMHQGHLASALWIPTLKALKQMFPGLKVGSLNGMLLLETGSYIGVGQGEAEASLSLLNSIRMQACC